MSFSLRTLKASVALFGVLLAGETRAAEEPPIRVEGSEARIMFELPGAQMHPDLSLGTAGGFLVSQDNSVDGQGEGIRARKIYADFSGARGSFAVNSEIAGEQRNPQTAILKDGGAAFVWISPSDAGTRVMARFMNASGVFTSTDFAVTQQSAGFSQSDARVAALANGNAVIVWSSSGQDGHMMGIYGQRFSNTGARLGAEFRVNQVTSFSQRTADVTGLPNGNFVVAWVTEEQRKPNTFDINARIYSGEGVAVTQEFRLNDTDNVCANPVLHAMGTSGFAAFWSERGYNKGTQGWEISFRTFNNAGAAQIDTVTVNEHARGDQYVPSVAEARGKFLVVWTSLGQDGYDEGVYARLMDYTGVGASDEFRVNTTRASKQFQPTVASDGNDRFIVTWTSFTGLARSYDLFCQKYRLNLEAPLEAPEPPALAALSRNSFLVTWPDFLGENVAQYEVYVDGAATPHTTQEIKLVLDNPAWGPGSSHKVKFAYVLKDGRRSPASAEASVTTWRADGNGDGLPDDWQATYWGSNPVNWAWADADPDEDGASNLKEFLAGTSPIDADDVLLVSLTHRAQGMYLEWNTRAGNVYQVQYTSDFKSWSDLGSERFAPGTSDAVPIGTPVAGRYYRVIRSR